VIRHLSPGGWYADALPSGEYCVLFPSSHIDTHLGALTLPRGEAFGPLYLRCSNVGGFKFAGQAHDTLNPAGWEWTEGNGWRPLPPPCVGTSPLIYDRLGVLHSSDGSIGSQGWRYCLNDGTPEGHLVTGDQTYTREVAPGVLIHEYTDVDGLLIGQGHDGGTVVWDGVALRLLESGDGRFVRANVDGDRVAVSFVKSDGAVIVQTTLAELHALPVVTPPAPVPVPVPQPKPEPVPMRLPDGVQAIVDALYHQFTSLAHGDDDQRRELTKKIVEQVTFQFPGQNYGWKSAHAHGLAPSKDSLAKRLVPFPADTPAPAGALISWDLFNGSTREPNRLPESSDIPGQYFLPLAGVNHLGTAPVPVPVPVPPSPGTPMPVPPDALADILRRLEKLEGPRTVAIRTDNGHYLCAEGGGGGTVNASRTAVGAWETVTLEPQP
jgi:hypothetical protein